MNKTLDAKTLLKNCKTNSKKESLMFVNLTRTMFKDNPAILNKYFKNEYNCDCYYANLLKLSDLSLDLVKAVLKKDFGQPVSLKGYRYNPKHYKFVTEYMQNDYEEDLFREQDDIVPQDRRIEMLDIAVLNRLYNILFKAIQTRTVMLFNLESVPGILNNAIDCYYKGVSCGASNAAMANKIKEIKALFANAEFREWYKYKPTDLIFNKEDYVSTYQKILRQLTEIRDNSLFELKDMIHNIEDIFEDEILANDIPEFSSYYEEDLEDFDDYLD